MSGRVREGYCLTFDDVLLVPARSSVLPRDVSLRTRFSRSIAINIPVVSAAMDTVTESRLAIAMAQHGGMGVIHRNMALERQAAEVRAVKKHESWIIANPVTISSSGTIGRARKLMEEFGISGLPVVDGEALAGIITNRDLRFKTDTRIKVADAMTRNPVTIGEDAPVKEAVRLLDEHKIEKLLVTDRAGRLRGLITVKDISKRKEFPGASKDPEGRLVVAAAVGPLDTKRAGALVEAGADALVIDTAHGHSDNVLKGIREMKPLGVDVVAGNIATAEAAGDLISAGADAIKVGIGPGSICTTRVVAGTGVPQVTAIQDCAGVASAQGVPLIADGGVKYSGDAAKAIAAGADSVMLGSLLAGTEESPGRVVFVGGRKYKSYRGMGSAGAMQDGSGRYAANGERGKFVPEGVEGIVPYRGAAGEMLFQMVGGLRSAMGYCGCGTIGDMKSSSRFIRITKAGMRESHPHDITITEEAPNYWASEREQGDSR